MLQKIFKEHRLNAARPVQTSMEPTSCRSVQTSMDLTSCEAYI